MQCAIAVVTTWHGVALRGTTWHSRPGAEVGHISMFLSGLPRGEPVGGCADAGGGRGGGPHRADETLHPGEVRPRADRGAPGDAGAARESLRVRHRDRAKVDLAEQRAGHGNGDLASRAGAAPIHAKAQHDGRLAGAAIR